jgi:hypothetical protein
MAPRGHIHGVVGAILVGGFDEGVFYVAHTDQPERH